MRNATRVVVGTLTDEGVECQALRSDHGDLYTLIGELHSFRNGDRVVVEGSVADVSYCQQGTTMTVLTIRFDGSGSSAP